MKRREWRMASIGTTLLILSGFLLWQQRYQVEEQVLDSGCRVPLRVIRIPSGHRDLAAVIFHGLAANRRIMQTMGKYTAEADVPAFLVDLPGHGDSTEAFSFARAEECAALALDTLARRGDIRPETTVLIGHSMGGAIAVRLADRFPAAATIAISPAPMVLPHRMPANLLVISAQFDLAPLKETAQQLLRAAGGQRDQPEDFLQRRAFRLEEMNLATHTSLILVSETEIGRWLQMTWPKHVDAPAAYLSTSFAVAVTGLIGLLLLFPLAAGLITVALRAGGSEREPKTDQAPTLLSPGGGLMRWTIAGLFAVCVLNFVMPLQTLRMLTGDYLASLLLIAGIVLWTLHFKPTAAALSFEPRALAMAFLLGLGTMLAFGAWLNWQLTDAWLNAPRWLRFAYLVPIFWPYCFVEEVALGSPRDGDQRGRGVRFVLFLGMRFVLWLACVFALYVFHSGQILILLLVIYMAALSIFQRLGADAVRRRTGSVASAAVFGAILLAWFIAAVFPLK